MMALALKAQTNHFADLNIELRVKMNKRFEQAEKRFVALTIRIDRFMIWSFATTLSVGGIVIIAIKFLP